MINTKDEFIRAVKDKEFNYNVLSLNHAHFVKIACNIHHEADRMQHADDFRKKEFIEFVKRNYIEHFCIIEKLFGFTESLNKDMEVKVNFGEKGLSIELPKLPDWYDKLFVNGQLSFKLTENSVETIDEEKYKDIEKIAIAKAFEINCNNLENMTDEEKEKYVKRQFFFKKLDDISEGR